MPADGLLTQDYLKSILDYDPDTGHFRWRSRPGYRSRGWSEKRAGKVAGTPSGDGYFQIQIDFVIYKAHRLAFLYMTGSTPEMVDHIDNDRSNTRWTNLREATRSQNFGNSRRRHNNTSGVKGVHWNALGKNWRARIQVDKRSISLGCYPTKEEAAKAYAEAAFKFFGEFARLG